MCMLLLIKLENIFNNQGWLWLLRSVVALTRWALIYNKVRKHENSQNKRVERKSNAKIRGKNHISITRQTRFSLLLLHHHVECFSAFLWAQLQESHTHVGQQGYFVFLFYKLAVWYAFIWQRTFRSKYVWTSLQYRFSTKL